MTAAEKEKMKQANLIIGSKEVLPIINLQSMVLHMKNDAGPNVPDIIL